MIGYLLPLAAWLLVLAMILRRFVEAREGTPFEP